jgi:hypothetical protein
MTSCPICAAAMVYRYNANYARTQYGSTYAYFCVTNRSHMVEDLSLRHAV